MATLLLSVLATVAGCKDEKGEKARAPRAVDGLAAVPATVSTVLVFDLRALAKAQLVQRAVTELLARDSDLAARAQTLLDGCQLVPGEDVTTAVIALGMDRSQSLLIALGTFDEAALATCVGKTVTVGGGELTRERDASGRVVYQARGAAQASPVFFALGSPTTLVAASSPEFLAEALGEGERLEANRRLGELVARADRKLAIWGVGLVPDGVGAGMVGKAGIAKPPQAMVLGVDTASGLGLRLDVEMASDEDANAAVSHAKPQLAAASLVAQKEGLGALVARIEIQADGRWVVLSLAMDGAELGEIMARVQRTVDTTQGPQQNPASDGAPSAEAPP